MSNAANIAAQMYERSRQANLARKDLNLARDLSSSLKEQPQKAIDLIPGVQSFLQESGLINGKKQHVIGIKTKSGKLLRIESKNEKIYRSNKPGLLKRKIVSPQDFYITEAKINELFQAVIDQTNVRFFMWGDLLGVDQDGQTFQVGGTELEQLILDLNQNGNQVEDKGLLKSLRRKYQLGLIPVTHTTIEGSSSSVEGN